VGGGRDDFVAEQAEIRFPGGRGRRPGKTAATNRSIEPCIVKGTAANPQE